MTLTRLSKSVVGQLEANAVADVIINDGYLGMGNSVKKFEQELAEYLSVNPPDVTCLNSGTAALHLAVEAVTDPGDQILIQSLTFVASYQAISAAGAIPVSCEIDPHSWTIDLQDAEKRITPKTKAIMPVHYGSNPGDLDKIYDFAAKFGLRVIEDAAHAFGCTYKNQKIGSFGDIVCFSFDGIKNITSGEGGAVVTKDTTVQSRIKDARLLGVEKDTEKRYAGQRSWDFDVTRQGYRYHMSNIFAAIGMTQLARLDKEFAPKRRRFMQAYVEMLKDCPHVIFQKTDSDSWIIPHICPVRITGGLRDKVINSLKSHQIQTGMHYKPNHLLTFYGSGKERLPLSEKYYEELISLPLHPELDIRDIEKICHTILDACLQN